MSYADDIKFNLANIPTASTIQSSFYDEEFKEILERNQKEIFEQKSRERQISEENNRNLKKIADNTDRIVLQMENIHKLLISINNLYKNDNEKLIDILNHLKETKHITAEVYSVLFSLKFKTEEERVNTSGQLTNLFMNGLDVSSNLISVITALSLNQ